MMLFKKGHHSFEKVAHHLMLEWFGPDVRIVFLNGRMTLRTDGNIPESLYEEHWRVRASLPLHHGMLEAATPRREGEGV